MPDRDYYLMEDKEKQRAMYVEHIANLLSLLYRSDRPSISEDAASAVTTTSAANWSKLASDLGEVRRRAERIVELETVLARAHMSRTDNRDPHATYNRRMLQDVAAGEESGGRLDFVAYVGPSKCEGWGPVNVRNTSALAEAERIVTSMDDPEDLRCWLHFKCVSSCAPYLSEPFVQEHFDFHERKLSGTEQIKPRWKRAMAWTEAALGEALGQLYCARHFDDNCKARAYRIVDQVRQALEDRLKEVEWITSDSTRQHALEKMSKFRIKVGSGFTIDYSSLQLNPDMTFLEMVFASRAFDHARAIAEMNAPTDREKWFMTPQTVNAYYHPSLNEIVFPAAILQFPFFDRDADDAVNYGAIGAVVGHEMTHGFDDKGRKFDAAGTLSDWWTSADAEEYERRVQVVVQQAEAFQVHGASVQGRLTSGENIADLGGLRLALRALRAQPGFDPAATIDGFTCLQRFFLAWAQCWRQNITKERALQLVVLDPHGPNEMRCNGPLSNIPEFYHAFGITEGSPMFRRVSERVDIW
jgi:putative endopeptidase